MKLSKFIVFSSVLLAMVLTSCTGEDGADGLDGLDGLDGTNGINGADGNTGPAGTDGTDGIDGIDGNANVTHLSFEFMEGQYDGSSTISLAVEELTVEVLAEDTVLYYLVRDGGNPNAIAYYSIPGLGIAGDYTIGVFAQAGTATISFRNFDGSAYQLSNDEFTGAKVVIIESSNQTTSKTLAGLKSAGIDVNDYNAVAKHFNLQ
nr:hypothetical protein [uncultured Allomuricauda sp.]